MIHAYRLVYPISQHAPPQLWEFEQPYIENLLLNARTFDRFVVQWYFEDWAAFDHDNTRIWNTYYRTKPLFDHLPHVAGVATRVPATDYRGAGHG